MSGYYHQGHFYRTDEWGTVVEGPADGAWPTQPGYLERLTPEPQLPYSPWKQKPLYVKRGGQWIVDAMGFLRDVPLEELRAYDQVAIENGFSTIWPEFDFETYSEGGYRWDERQRKWKSLHGFSEQKRGLSVVGTRNYVEHPSFRLLSLS